MWLDFNVTLIFSVFLNFFKHVELEVKVLFVAYQLQSVRPMFSSVFIDHVIGHVNITDFKL